jgi:hypothetical protein
MPLAHAEEDQQDPCGPRHAGLLPVRRDWLRWVARSEDGRESACQGPGDVCGCPGDARSAPGGGGMSPGGACEPQRLEAPPHPNRPRCCPCAAAAALLPLNLCPPASGNNQQPCCRSSAQPPPASRRCELRARKRRRRRTGAAANEAAESGTAGSCVAARCASAAAGAYPTYALPSTAQAALTKRPCNECLTAVVDRHHNHILLRSGGMGLCDCSVRNGLFCTHGVL